MKMIAIAASMVVVAGGGLAGILVGGASAELARDREALAPSRSNAATVIMRSPARVVTIAGTPTPAPATRAHTEPVRIAPSTPAPVVHSVAALPEQSGIRARAVPEQMFTGAPPAPSMQPQTAAPMRNRARITASVSPPAAGPRSPSSIPAPALRVTTHAPSAAADRAPHAAPRPAATPTVTVTIQHPPASTAHTRANHRDRGTQEANTGAPATTATHPVAQPAAQPAPGHPRPAATQQATTSPILGTPLPAAGPAPDATHQTTVTFAGEPPPSAPPPPVTAPQESTTPPGPSEQAAAAAGNP